MTTKTLATLLAENTIYADIGTTRAVDQTFSGTDGFLNIVSYENDPSTRGVQISLNDPVDFGAYGEASGDIFVNISGLIGTNANDSLGGSGSVNVLRGLGGDDTLYGISAGIPRDLAVGGGDTLDGGEGTDLASYEYTKGAVIINLATDENGGFATGDVLIDIENLRGSGFDDLLIGDSGDNRLEGGLGNDTLMGGEGADRFYGNKYGNSGAAGEVDTVSYQYSKSAIAYDMTYSVQAVGDAADDYIDVTVENVIGTSFNDTIGGSGYNNTLNGGDGDDYLAGHGGDDELNGGNGFDFASYSRSDVGAVQVSLVAGAVNTGGDAAGDVLIDIEGLVGSKYGDELTGNDLDNALNGWLGADTMTGGDGNDTYYVDTTSDQVVETATGGAADLVYTEINYTLGAYVENLKAQSGTAGMNALKLTGNTLDNDIAGNEYTNTIKGDLGNDTLHGGLGKDTLYGGAGSDVFVFDTAPSTGNADRLADFNYRYDAIHLDNSIFTALAEGALAKSAFYTGSKAHDRDDRLIYNKTKGYLYYDPDGTGSASKVLIGTVKAYTKLYYTDFLVI